MQKEIKRKCQACASIKNRQELIKITKINDNEIKINPNSKELGRSVYVCKNIECIKLFIKKKRIRSGLKFNNNAEIQKIENEILSLLDSCKNEN